MKVLIDTQSIIWFAENNPQLSRKACAAIENMDNQCLVSMASFWEMSIKMNLGKLSINGLSLLEFMNEVSAANFSFLDIRREHIIENTKLPFYHRDPFDRLIIAQALVENLAIISSDEIFDLYPITRIWK